MSSEPEFPGERFAGAGATSAEVDSLRADFISGDLSVRRSFSDLWASMSDGGLREHLANLRASGRLNQGENPAATESALDGAESGDAASDVSTTEKDESDESSDADAQTE